MVLAPPRTDRPTPRAASSAQPRQCHAPVKLTLTSDDSVRYEAAPGMLTVEAESADRQYSPFHMLGGSLAV